jgi:nitronate monooxygenase
LRPPSEIVEAAHFYGGVVFHDVINAKHARKAAGQG